jgi:hypothetical protein
MAVMLRVLFEDSRTAVAAGYEAAPQKAAPWRKPNKAKNNPIPESTRPLGGPGSAGTNEPGMWLFIKEIENLRGVGHTPELGDAPPPPVRRRGRTSERSRNI